MAHHRRTSARAVECFGSPAGSCRRYTSRSPRQSPRPDRSSGPPWRSASLDQLHARHGPGGRSMVWFALTRLGPAPGAHEFRKSCDVLAFRTLLVRGQLPPVGRVTIERLLGDCRMTERGLGQRQMATVELLKCSVKLVAAVRNRE